MQGFRGLGRPENPSTAMIERSRAAIAPWKYPYRTVIDA